MSVNRKKVVSYISIAINICLVILLGTLYEKRAHLQENISEKVLRFHVLANSDMEEDQALKLKVRDAVGTEMAQMLDSVQNKEECEKIVSENLKRIETIAEEVIVQEGYSYEAHAYLDEVEFPVKTYGEYTFPAGKYDALEVVIGEGAGKNWWCVMYPNMCFRGSVYEVVDEDAREELREVLSEEEYEQVIDSGDYQVQFKYLSFLNELVE